MKIKSSEEPIGKFVSAMWFNILELYQKILSSFRIFQLFYAWLSEKNYRIILADSSFYYR